MKVSRRGVCARANNPRRAARDVIGFPISPHDVRPEKSAPTIREGPVGPFLAHRHGAPARRRARNRRALRNAVGSTGINVARFFGKRAANAAVNYGRFHRPILPPPPSPSPCPSRAVRSGPRGARCAFYPAARALGDR